MAGKLPDLSRPAPYRHGGPIIDAHCHFGTPAATARMLQAGADYGVTRWVGICRIDQVAGLRRRFGSRLDFVCWTDHRRPTTRQRFVDTNLRIIERAVRLGCRGLKFWYKPEFNAATGLYFDSPWLDAVFEAMIAASLPALVHIADPDLWWRTRYADAERFDPKPHTYRQLTNTLERFGRLRVLVAHMGGWPENLPFLDALLDRYPNCFLDTSATRWMARELSARAAAARAFIIRRSDRLLFGSDLVVAPRAAPDHYRSRYYVMRHLLERDRPERSCIPDDDAARPVQVAGLKLPPRVLRRLYHDNAAAFFRLEVP